MLKAWARAVAAIVLCSVEQALAKPITNFEIQHYPVTGNSIAEIQNSINTNTPVNSGGGKFGGATVWALETEYGTRTTPDGGCSIVEPIVRLNIKVVLPKLVPGSKLSEAGRREWVRFLGALRAHELLHAKNGLYTATTLEKKMTNLRTKVSCERTKEVLNRGSNALIENITQRDRDMDKQTVHGKTQGAYLDIRVDK